MSYSVIVKLQAQGLSNRKEHVVAVFGGALLGLIFPIIFFLLGAQVAFVFDAVFRGGGTMDWFTITFLIMLDLWLIYGFSMHLGKR